MSPPVFVEQLADRRPRIALLIDGFAMDFQRTESCAGLFAAPSIERPSAAKSSSPRERAPNINDSPCAFCFEWRLMGAMISHSA